MREGFYSIVFVGVGGGRGSGVLVLDTGTVVGADSATGKYDGVYAFNQRTEMIDIEVTVTVPAGVATVMGTPPLDSEMTFPVKASFPRETPEHPILVETPFGQVNVLIAYLRGFPN